MIIYNCTTCNKNYKTRGGLWKHNKTKTFKQIDAAISFQKICCSIFFLEKGESSLFFPFIRHNFTLVIESPD